MKQIGHFELDSKFLLFVMLFLSFFILFIIPVYANDGSSITEVEEIEHDPNNGSDNSLVQVDSDTYALAYSGPGFDGFISTFTIPADGSSITEVTTLEHDTSLGNFTSFVQVDSDTYALAYQGDGDKGIISTFTITADGSSITEVASLEHDTTNGEHNSLVKVDTNTYVLAYGDASNGKISTFTIPVDGSTITKVTTLEHVTTEGEFNSLVQVDSDTYALAYAGRFNDGYIVTFTISTTSTSSSGKSIGASVGSAASPSFTKFLVPNEYPLSIHGTNYAYDDFTAKKTTTLSVGEPIQIKVLASDDGGGSDIQRISLYMNLYGLKRELFESNTAISYVNYKEPTIRNTDGIIESFTVSTYPNGMKQEITFDIIFAKEMPLSDIIIQVVDEVNNSVQIRASEAIQVIKAAPIENEIVEPEIEIPQVDPKLKEQLQLPNWIKQTGKSWADNKISDNGFSRSLGFMIHNDILQNEDARKIIHNSNTYDEIVFDIPPYLKNNAIWLGNDLISDIEFVNAIQFHLDNEYIKLKS